MLGTSRWEWSLLHACCSSVLCPLDPKLTKAVFFREALSWVKDRDFQNIIFETDSQLLAQAFLSNDPDIFLFNVVVSACKSLLNQIPNNSVYFAHRLANSVAHCLTTSVSFSIWSIEVWSYPSYFYSSFLKVLPLKNKKCNFWEITIRGTRIGRPTIEGAGESTTVVL